MKKILILSLAALLPVLAQAQTQITNGDFETWTFDGEHLPNNFNSFQTADGSYASYAQDNSNRGVKRSTDTRPGSKGSYSCAIWGRKIKFLGISVGTAQGNLTTGQVYAGSKTATNENNYNFTNRGKTASNGSKTNPLYMSFTGRPDSLVVWVKFVPKGTDSSHPYAKVSAIIHDDVNYRDIYGKTYDESKLVATASNTTISKTNGWKRLSIPFQYTNNSAQPKYILFNAATNAYPGAGNENDYLYIDDIELVYNQSYQLSVPSQGWASMYLDFNAKVPANAKVYYVTELVAGYAKLQEIPAGSIIPAKTGVLVRSDASSVTFESSVMEPVAVTGNILKGTLSSTPCEDESILVLSPASTKDRAVFGLYQGRSLGAHKAYIAL